MARPENTPQRLLRKANWAVRALRPHRPVVREVQGVSLTLPWSHHLPDYARVFPAYGQNVVALARSLAEEGTLHFIDVGANVGDTTLQILAAVEGRALCIEADRYWLTWLRRNVDDDERVTVLPALLVAEDDAEQRAVAPVRSGGTTRFVASAAADSAASISATELRARFTEFESVRLIKSDTDGHDVTLIPRLAREFDRTGPVLFFEYDHHLSRLAENDPLRVWEELADLGYSEVAAWDNVGAPVLRGGFEEAVRRSAELDTGATRNWPYWDVAVARGDDAAGVRALDAAFA